MTNNMDNASDENLVPNGQINNIQTRDLWYADLSEEHKRKQLECPKVYELLMESPHTEYFFLSRIDSSRRLKND